MFVDVLSHAECKDQESGRGFWICQIVQVLETIRGLEVTSSIVLLYLSEELLLKSPNSSVLVTQITKSALSEHHIPEQLRNVFIF